MVSILIVIFGYIVIAIYKRSILLKSDQELVLKVKKLKKDGLKYDEISENLLKCGMQKDKIRDAISASTTYINIYLDIFNIVVILIASFLYLNLNYLTNSNLKNVSILVFATFLFLNIYLPHKNSIK